MTLFDINSLRNDFPMLKKTMHGKPLIYFDSAATSQKPQCVINAIINYYQDHCGTVHRAIYELATTNTEAYNLVRSKVKNFLNAEYEEEIIFTRGTTAAINLVAKSFGKAFIRKGDIILISHIEHHSNIVPWQMLCEETGAILKVIPVDENGDIDMQALEKMLNCTVKLLSIAHVSNALGTIHPVKKIIQLAHKFGTKVLIDGAQAVSHMKVDVRDLNADFYAFSGHKLYGPTGVGVLYGKKVLLEILPPIEGGGDMIETVTFEKTTYQKPPLRFEAGTPMIAQVLGLGAAIDYISQIGIEKIGAWELALLQEALFQLKQIPEVKILADPKERGPIISFTVDNAHPLDIASFLDLKGIAIRSGHHCSQPALELFNIHSSARISFGLYNTKEEISYFVNALKELIKYFAK